MKEYKFNNNGDPELMIARDFANRMINTQYLIIDKRLLQVMGDYNITKQDAPKRMAIQHHPHGIFIAVDGNIVTENLRLNVVIKKGE